MALLCVDGCLGTHVPHTNPNQKSARDPPPCGRTSRSVRQHIQCFLLASPVLKAQETHPGGVTWKGCGYHPPGCDPPVSEFTEFTSSLHDRVSPLTGGGSLPLRSGSVLSVQVILHYTAQPILLNAGAHSLQHDAEPPVQSFQVELV